MTVFTPAIAALARFDWCHQDVRKRPDTSLVADVFWWERRQDVPGRIAKIAAGETPLDQTSELFFCLAYAAMCIGDIPLYQHYANRLDAEAPHPILKQWLRIEYMGRSREYLAQAKEVEAIVRREGALPDWVVAACLASLNHQGIKPKPLLSLLSPLPVTGGLMGLLMGRLIAADGNAAQALKLLAASREQWPDVPALRWFEGVMRAQVGDHALALQLIREAFQQGFSDMNALRFWFSTIVSAPRDIDIRAIEGAYRQVISFLTEDVRQTAEMATYMIIRYWMEGNLPAVHGLLQQYHTFQDMEERQADRPAQVFMRYAVRLCVAWQYNEQSYQSTVSVPSLHVLGESHALTSANLVFDWLGGQHRAKTSFVMGVKMWHLADKKSPRNPHKTLIEAHLAKISNEQPLLLTIGEIDCRPDEGIWKAHKKTGRPLNVLIKATVQGYLNYLEEKLAGRSQVTIAGVPAPNYSLDGKRDPGNRVVFLAMIKEVNEQLKAGALARGWSFLDLYAATLGEEGMSNQKWHLEGWHLQPMIYVYAMNWLVQPT